MCFVRLCCPLSVSKAPCSRSAVLNVSTVPSLETREKHSWMLNRACLHLYCPVTTSYTFPCHRVIFLNEKHGYRYIFTEYSLVAKQQFYCSSSSLTEKGYFLLGVFQQKGEGEAVCPEEDLSGCMSFAWCPLRFPWPFLHSSLLPAQTSLSPRIACRCSVSEVELASRLEIGDPDPSPQLKLVWQLLTRPVSSAGV